MGWASGSRLFDDVLRATMPSIPQANQKAVVRDLVVAFQDLDCDTLDECCEEWPVVREVLRELDPELYEEDP